MPILGGNLHNYCATAQKRLGHEGDPDPLNVNGIYQRRHGKKYTYYLRMEFYEPTNPQSPEQQSNRAKFASAVLMWRSLTQEQKNVYNEIAKYRQYSGYNLFIHRYMILH